MPSRSTELIQVGYFLSREGKTDPPEVLQTKKWFDAYLMFYAELNNGRTPLEFEHSLKNIRDQFDGYFHETQREGWKNPKNKKEPAKLSHSLELIYHKFKDYSSEKIWESIKKFADFNIKPSQNEYHDAFQPQRFDYYKEKIILTEGGRRAIISNYIERNLKIRRSAINFHGLNCAGCGFNFETFYGQYAQGFIEIHHLKPLSQEQEERRQTNYQTDVIPLCSNCHSVVHRKRNKVLSLNELRKLIEQKNSK